MAERQAEFGHARIAPVLADEIRMFAHSHGQWLPLNLARHLAAQVVEPMLVAAEERARAEVADAFMAWAAKNEIAAPPLDWAWFGEIARRYSPLHEQYEMRSPPAQTIGEPCRQCGPGYWIGDDGCRHGAAAHLTPPSGGGGES